MKILVVSGFLGAGKTTFIKELIRRTGKEIAVLENEYGDTDLDSRDIQETGELKVWEFMEGCVCCSKKDSFANTIVAISASLDPEYLVVEPTGVGRLSNIIGNIRKVSYERIKLLNPLVVLAPVSYHSNMNEYTELYTDQIANAGGVIFSKIEYADPDMLRIIEEEISGINPHARISDVPYKEHDDEWWDSILKDPEDEAEEPANPTGEPEAFNEHEQMKHVSFRGVQLMNVSELILVLEDVIRSELGSIVRAKGVIRAGSEYVRFDVADGMYAICGFDGAADSQAVFIGADPDMAGLEKRLHMRAANNDLRDMSLLRRNI